MSVITEHRLESNPDFDWKGVRILDYKNNYNKRMISEMLQIKLQHNAINVMSDTEALKLYFAFLELYKN